MHFEKRVKAIADYFIFVVVFYSDDTSCVVQYQ